jgi:hypothetical protein
MKGKLDVIRILLWVFTIAILALIAVQGLSGNWITYYMVLPGGPTLAPGLPVFLAELSVYHVRTGFAIGAISILVLVLAFLKKSNIYLRVFSVVGLLLTASAAMGGYLFVMSGFQDRWPLGQMTDSFVGAFAAYFIQLFFMNGIPWARKD